MANNYSDINACCAALDRVGENPIEALDGSDTSPAADTCSRQYPLARDSILSAHDWDCTKVERYLSISGSVTPLGRWARAFVLPDEMIAGPIAVYGDGSRHPTFDHEIMGGYLYANYDTVKVVFKVTPPESAMPAYLYDLIVLATAQRICVPLTRDSELAGELRIELYGHANLDGNGGMFARAKAIEARNKPTKSILKNGDPLTRARR